MGKYGGEGVGRFGGKNGKKARGLRSTRLLPGGQDGARPFQVVISTASGTEKGNLIDVGGEGGIITREE